MSEPLLDDVLHLGLRTQVFGRNRYLLQKIDSTNQFAKKLASKGAPEGTLVYAEEQSMGRGRWGRTWESQSGKGLWFSVVLRPKYSPSAASLLTLLGAVSIVSALEKAYKVRLSLQWPNDVFFHKKKIAGVLTEMLRNRDGISHAILGIGLNVFQKEKEFSSEVRERAGSLSMAVHQGIDRFCLLSEILNQLELDYREAQELGYRPILERWVSYSNLIGRKIVLKVNDCIERGRVKGFHSNGDLILFSEDGIKKRFSDGRVLEVQYAARD